MSVPCVTSVLENCLFRGVTSCRKQATAARGGACVIVTQTGVVWEDPCCATGHKEGECVLQLMQYGQESERRCSTCMGQGKKRWGQCEREETVLCEGLEALGKRGCLAHCLQNVTIGPPFSFLPTCNVTACVTYCSSDAIVLVTFIVLIY